MKIISKNNGWLIEPDTSDEYKCLKYILNAIGRAYESKASGAKEIYSANRKSPECQTQTKNLKVRL